MLEPTRAVLGEALSDTDGAGSHNGVRERTRGLGCTENHRAAADAAAAGATKSSSTFGSRSAGFGTSPSSRNMAKSSDSALLGVVRSFSPVKIEFAPAMKHRAWRSVSVTRQRGGAVPRPRRVPVRQA